MPGGVYARIPRDAAQADAMLPDGRDSFSFGDGDTFLQRDRASNEIVLRYKGSTIVRWYAHGSFRVYFSQSGDPFNRMTPRLRRQACVLPDDWELRVGERMHDGRRRRPRLMYRGAWMTELVDITFRSDGGIQWQRSFDDPAHITADNLDHEVSQIDGFAPVRSRRRRPRPLPSYFVRPRGAPVDRADAPCGFRYHYSGRGLLCGFDAGNHTPDMHAWVPVDEEVE